MVVSMRISQSKSGQSQRGITLIELVLATMVGAILLAGMNNVVKVGLDAQSSVRGSNELAYQGRFALERIADVARDRAPKVLTTTPAANTTGFWLATIDSLCSSTTNCTMYCRNASNQLIETTTSDTTCSGTAVIASNVSTFTASLPNDMGAVDRSIIVVSLTMADSQNNSLKLSSSIRLGGGAL